MIGASQHAAISGFLCPQHAGFHTRRSRVPTMPSGIFPKCAALPQAARSAAQSDSKSRVSKQ